MVYHAAGTRWLFAAGENHGALKTTRSLHALPFAADRQEPDGVSRGRNPMVIRRRRKPRGPESRGALNHGDIRNLQLFQT
jgi:hypothetical protein